MKPYYRTFFMLFLLAACGPAPAPTPKSIASSHVLSPVSADWHLFTLLTPQTRRLLSIVIGDREIPSIPHSIHLAGRKQHLRFIEAQGGVLTSMAAFLPNPAGWVTCKESTAPLARIRTDVTAETIQLPLIGNDIPFQEPADMIAWLGDGSNNWKGLITIRNRGLFWEFLGVMNAESGENAVHHPDASLVFVALPGSALANWLGSGGRRIDLAVSEETAILKVGSHSVSVGDGTIVSTGSPSFSLFGHYDRSNLRLPGTLSLPAAVHRGLRGFDSFDILCENRGPLEVCRGRFVLKEL
ncbi:MAG TPA: hypothetical protein PKV10_12175 [Thermoanaerobaculia bacterium]|nr:hypothetical protein [Thermoanaerobaculia bacterium]